MRLTAEETATSERLMAEIFGPEAAVWLFGSQRDDGKKGGDIDLLVEVPEDRARSTSPELQLHETLEEVLFGRTVDLFVRVRGTQESPFVRIARNEGVGL